MTAMHGPFSKERQPASEIPRSTMMPRVHIANSTPIPAKEEDPEWAISKERHQDR